MAFYEENPLKITRADVVVAIPTYNEVESIGQTTDRVTKGLLQYFSAFNCLVINCDNNSRDGTKEAFFATPGEIPKIYLSTPPGTQGKGNNLRALFEKVRELEARAVVVVESDIENLAPYWVRNLGEPLLKGAGYTVPLYVRNKYESTLTSSTLYPLVRCLYGRRVRQPDAGDFGFKGQLAETYLNSDMWTPSVQSFGIDIWMTTIALNSRLPICQAFMGTPKIHRRKDPYANLSVLFHQVLRTLFDVMGVSAPFWQQVKWSKPTALFGTDIQEVETPLPADVNTSRLQERFVQGFDQYSQIWQRVFDQTICHKLQEIRSMNLQHFSFPTQAWARILFDAAAAYQRMKPEDRETMLDSLLPLYLGKVLSYVKKTERMSIQQAEEYVENECVIFEENKPYIVKIWG